MKGLGPLQAKLTQLKRVMTDPEPRREAGKEWVETKVVPTAKRLVPRDTGKLDNSIGPVIEGDRFGVEATEPYAIHVEQGTHKAEAQPFMRPAIEDNLPALLQITRQHYARRLK